MKVKNLIGLTDSEKNYYLIYNGRKIEFAYRWDEIIDKKYKNYLDYEIELITIHYDEYNEPYIAIILK